MDFEYTITFETETAIVGRQGRGLFYPHDGGFNLEHMLWIMTEELGRPVNIKLEMKFTGVEDTPLLLSKG